MQEESYNRYGIALFLQRDDRETLVKVEEQLEKEDERYSAQRDSSKARAQRSQKPFRPQSPREGTR